MEPLPVENTAVAAHSFDVLQAAFENQFNDRLFPPTPVNLYNAIDYQLKSGGKRIRPVLCLMGNVLAGPLQLDAFLAANALELFHNFTLAHDDVMEATPLRRGRPALHIKYNAPTAILTGDTLLYAYDYLNRIQGRYKQKIIQLFNEAARAVCEGQQMDLDQESTPLDMLSYTDYLHKVILKNAALLAVSLQIGAIIGSAGITDQEHIYSFGKNAGVALQLQEDYREAFQVQEPEILLKQKKTSLLLKAYEWSSPEQRSRLQALLAMPAAEATNSLAQLYKACKADEWILKEKERLQQIARQHLDQLSVPAINKRPLLELANLLFDR